MNIEEVYKWINSLEDFKDQDKIEDSFYAAFPINQDPFYGLVIAVYADKVLFFKRGCFFKVYYPPKKLHVDFKCNKHKFIKRVQTDKFWVYYEVIESVGSRKISFGMLENLRIV